MRETTVSFYPSKRKLKIEWRCEFFRQILSFLTTISILESNIFIRGTVIVEEEREKEDIYIYIYVHQINIYCFEDTSFSHHFDLTE